MQTVVVLRVVGIMLILFSTTLLPALVVSLIYRDGAETAFFIAFAITLASGVILWLPTQHARREIRVRDGFVIVTLFWTVLGLFGALPLAIADRPHMPFTDAVFESISGLTTTGATVLTGIDELPHSIRYYRQQLQWLGGMGIVVLAVAVMPMLGVGGMQLYRAETPGPIKDTKLTPRIAETAKALWYIYLGLTAACALAYWLAGMEPFDAIGHSFTTVATGGYSTHDRSMGYFDSAAIDIIAIVFMLAGAINFALHFMVWHRRSLSAYFADAELRTFFVILAALVALYTAMLYAHGTFGSPGGSLRGAAFHVVSVVTSTGFTTTGFDAWPSFLPLLLIMVSFFGGCAGSTAGGIKIVRILLLYKQGMREIFRLVHPAAVTPIKIGGRAMDETIINAVWGFFVLYVFAYGLLSIAMIGTGLDPVTAFSAVAASINLLGPGLGEVAANYAGVSTAGKWILSFAMLLGRLELFTLLVLFTRIFWRG